MKNLNEFKSERDEKVQDLERQLQDREKILQNYRKEHGKLEVFFDRVEAQIMALTPQVSNYTPKAVKSGSSVVPVMHVTDSHMGAVQEPYEIEDFNAFNPELCDERNLKFVKGVLDWNDLHRNIYTINEVAVLFTGDLISGDIHDELKITNAFSSPEQVVRAAQIHTKQIALLASNFEKVTVHFVTEDNHSRLTKKPQAKEAGINSFNYLVARLMEAYLKGHGNVEFNVYPMLEKVVNVNGMKYLIGHGHNVRGWMGVPWYGIERKVGKESQARMRLIMSEIERAETIGFDKYVIGHFHTPFDTPLYCCGGSVSGTDAYDHQAGRYGDPAQSSWMVHAKRGEFNRTTFKLN